MEELNKKRVFIKNTTYKYLYTKSRKLKPQICYVECFAIEKDLSTMNIAKTAQATITNIML